MDAFIIILTGSLVAVSCGLLGSFLILRKMSMVGDAISHSVLPGIVIAFFLVESLQSVWMLVGAGLLGLLTTFLIEFFHQKGRLQTDASIGVTFTWLFALGSYPSNVLRWQCPYRPRLYLAWRNSICSNRSVV